MDQSSIIALKDVESTYKTKNQEQLYLKSINLNVTAGETVAIIGRAGAGKSALLRCIGLLERPLTGIVAIDNKNLTFLARKELCNERRNVGFVNGKPEFLNSKTVNKNIALPLQIQNIDIEEINRITARVLEKVALEGKANNYPNTLTNTQKIQADLARAIVNSPKILLCDDIFNHLDPKGCELICNLLRSLQQELKLTIIITTNDPEIIKSMCQNVIVMHQGMIIEQCSVFKLFTSPTSDVAKDFLRFTTKHELPLSLRRKIATHESMHNHALVRINFSECLAPEEILSNSLDAYQLKMNIIQAYQETIQTKLINVMLLEIFGDNEVVIEAMQFLNNNGLQSEIIGYVPNNI